VHVDGEGRGGRVFGQAALFAGSLCQGEPAAAEFLGNDHLEVPGSLQVFEVLDEEGVFTVVLRGAAAEGGEQLVRQEFGGLGGGDGCHMGLL
jgi:hypothetical protein